MAVAAESLQVEQTLNEEINRRTDDVLFNARHLQRHIIDRKLELFDPIAVADILEQDITEVAEADMHQLGAVVRQTRNANSGQFESLGTGMIENNIKGLLALNTEDPASLFEFYRRVEEVTNVESILIPEVEHQLRKDNTYKITASPSPTHHEANIDDVISFGYDDRSMFTLETLSVDGNTKFMQTFSLFDVPAEAWSAFFSDRYQEQVEPTALAVMQFCNRVLIEHGTPADILQEFIGGVTEYVPECDRGSVARQLDGFLNKQTELEQQATYYAHEKLAFQKDLALSLDTWAHPNIQTLMDDARLKLNQTDKTLLSHCYVGDKVWVNEYVAELATRIKTNTNDNRAGLAAMNERTVMRMASKIGLEETIELAKREQVIQQMPEGMREFMVRRSEQQINASGVGCGGGCSVSVVNPFSAEARLAREAGLGGTMYSGKELDNSSKCACSNKAKVIVDGSNVLCISCKTGKVNGKSVNLQKSGK